VQFILLQIISPNGLMKNHFFLVFTTLFCIICNAQDSIIGQYIGENYKKTKNNSFVSKELLFLKNKDTIKLNLKLPIDTSKNIVNDLGLFFNCHLKKDTIYKITLKKILWSKIPETEYSYYRINLISKEPDSYEFIEVNRNTPYGYRGNYGKYVDMNNIIYEIIGISPDETCFFSH
ncbi:hypothetical protein, partial [Flavobacterium aurantiibacter]